MRRSGVGVAALLLAAGLLRPSAAHATSYNPLTPDGEAVAPLAPGATVFLFHSGTEETRRSIRAGDVIPVYRPLVSGRNVAVGTIRVEAAAGELCFRGQVLEGEIQTNDVAAAGVVSCLVISSAAPCRHGTGR